MRTRIHTLFLLLVTSPAAVYALAQENRNYGKSGTSISR